MIYRNNPEIEKKYKSKRWQKLRDYKLKLNPVCERCSKLNIFVPAVIIHHKEYITDLNYFDDDVFFNVENLEALCRECHNKEHFKKNSWNFDSNGDLIHND